MMTRKSHYTIMLSDQRDLMSQLSLVEMTMLDFLVSISWFIICKEDHRQMCKWLLLHRVPQPTKDAFEYYPNTHR